MSYRLVNAPARVIGLIYGFCFGVAMSVSGYLQYHRMVPHLILGVVSGAAFGAIMGRTVARQNARVLAATGEDLSPDEKLVVLRAASSRQPMPDDARLRKAAAAALSQRLSMLDDQRPGSYAFFAVMAILTIVVAFTDSPWWLLATLALASAGVLIHLRSIRYQRRIAQLEAG